MLTREGEREVAPCFWYGRMHPKRPLVTSPFRRPYEQYREHQEPGGAIYGFGLEGGGVLWFFNPRSYPPPRLFDALPEQGRAHSIVVGVFDAVAHVAPS